jgi:hypothetical protein
MREQRFTRTALFIWAGLLIWMTNFLFVYVFAAVVCARRIGNATVFGLPLVPFATTLSSIFAAAATIAVVWLALRRMRLDPDASANTTFIRFLSLALAALALVALVWVALPPLLVREDC